MIQRRTFLIGLGAAFAAPSIIPIRHLMQLPRPRLEVIAGPRFLTPDFLACDGVEIPVSRFPDLYAVLGNTYGGTPGMTFQLPVLPQYGIAHADGETTPVGVLHHWMAA